MTLSEVFQENQNKIAELYLSGTVVSALYATLENQKKMVDYINELYANATKRIDPGIKIKEADGGSSSDIDEWVAYYKEHYMNKQTTAE